MKAGISIAMSIFVAGVLLGIVQLWFEPWAIETFIKLEITLGGLLLIVGAIWFVNKEYKEHKTNSSGNRLD